MEQKIIHVVNLQSYGGIQKLVLELTALLNKGHLVQNELLSTRKVDLLADKIPNNVKIVNVESGNIFTTFKNVLEVFKHYDIIHFHGPYTFYQFVALFSGKKIVYTEHGTLQRANIKATFKHLIQKRIFGRSYLEKYADMIIFISKWIQNDLALKNKNQVVLSNGLSYQEPNISEENGFILTLAARLIPKKRVHLAIELMHQLSHHPDIKLKIIGDGVEEERLKILAGDLLNTTVFFLGYRSDAYDLIAASDMYLMTTDMEPFGLVVLEAMMNSTIVLALKDSGGPTEILENYRNELIVSTVDDLAKAVLYWKDRPEEKLKMELNLKQLYESTYTLETMAENYQNVYLKLKQ